MTESNTRRVAGEEFSMMLFEEKEIVSYLNNRLEVKKSVYDAVVYDSELEREFAEKRWISAKT